MSQHRKLTMERKRLLQFLPGLERSTFRSRVRRATSVLSPLPSTLFWETAVGSQAVKSCNYESSVVWSFQLRFMPTFTLSLCQFSASHCQNLYSNGLIPKQSTYYYVVICAFQSLLILNFPFPKFILQWFDSETVFSLCRFSTFRFQNISSNGLIPKQSTDYYVMIFALRSVLLFCLYVLC